MAGRPSSLERLKSVARSILGAMGLLPALRAGAHRFRIYRRQRYYAAVVEQYRSPLARPFESYADYEQRERGASVGRARARYDSDLRLVEGAREVDAANRKAAAMAILDRVVDGDLAPRFYDYDYIDDIAGIVGGRYCSDAGADTEASRAVLAALSTLASARDIDELPAALRRLVGGGSRYVPPRSDVTEHVRKVIPDLVDEFIALKAETNVQRFLEINREYSRRQAHQLGAWDIRDLSLMRGYERDHHLLLRTLLSLIEEGKLASEDEVLLVGPRHIDEVVFFRKALGLHRTIGIDLFPSGRDEIIAGDMHDMPFDAGRFKLVFSAGTLSYAYNVRRVVDEIARITSRPAYVFLLDAGGRLSGPSALARSDIPTVEAMIGLFYRYRFQVLARDAGRSLAPHIYENEPCLALSLS